MFTRLVNKQHSLIELIRGAVTLHQMHQIPRDADCIRSVPDSVGDLSTLIGLLVHHDLVQPEHKSTSNCQQ